MHSSRRISFGSFSLDFANQQVFHNDEPLSLTRKSFETLAVLVSNAGQLVPKAQLKQLVWGDVYVEDATIAQNIFLLRRALGEREPGITLIETIAGVGYRFNGAVRDSSRNVPVIPDAHATLPQVPAVSTRMRLRLNGWWAAGALCVALAAGTWWRYGHTQAAQPQSLAVLPFSNLTGDALQDSTAAGLADSLLTDIGSTPGLRVVSGSSAARYAKDNSAKEIAGKLRVDGLVEGAIVRDSGRFWVDVRLIEAADDRTLWTSRYDLETHDLLSIERSISQALVGQTRLPVTGFRPATPVGGTESVQAYDEYLKGRFFWEKRTEADYLKAISHFEQALGFDQNYAQAYAGLADTYALLGSLPTNVTSRRDAMTQATNVAQRAIALDDTLAAAHTSLAFVHMHYEWNQQAAEREYRRALELDPNLVNAHQWYAYLLMATGRPDEAIREINRARELDPVSPILPTDAAELLFENRDYRAADAEARKALDLDPDFALAHFWLARALLGEGLTAEARSHYQRAFELTGLLWALQGIVECDVRAGEMAKADAEAQRLLALASKQGDTSSMEVANLYVSLGEKDKAFEYLERAVDDRIGGLIFIRQEPHWDPLRDDPRFARIVAQITNGPKAP
jgi:TolB-like protein/DNA-binding winged helix-turn-helix (wHTH) protein/Tfp pilus assembly protein PilF